MIGFCVTELSVDGYRIYYPALENWAANQHKMVVMIVRQAVAVEQTIEQDLNRSACDMVWGAEAIGREVGLVPAQVFYQIRIGRLPVVRRHGTRLYASKKELRAFFFGPNAAA